MEIKSLLHFVEKYCYQKDFFPPLFLLTLFLFGIIYEELMESLCFSFTIHSKFSSFSKNNKLFLNFFFYFISLNIRMGFEVEFTHKLSGEKFYETLINLAKVIK